MKKPDRNDLSDAVWARVYALPVGVSLHTHDGQGVALHHTIAVLIDQLIEGYRGNVAGHTLVRSPDLQVVGQIVERVDRLMGICSAEVESYANAICEHDLDKPILNGGCMDGK